MKRIPLLLSALALSACATYMPQRYSITTENGAALKAVAAGSIGVAAFKGPANFDNSCRTSWPIAPPENMSFEAYIQKALADELKAAGKFEDKTPAVTLSGALEKLEFSSIRGVTGGSWDIGLRVTSSNGKSSYVSEHYEFRSGILPDTACKQTAEAYLPAVQNLIGRLLRSPDFLTLVTPGGTQ